MEDSPIHSLGLSIRLKMGDRGKSMLDVEVDQELFKPSIIELCAIVHDNQSRETISTYDGFPDKKFYPNFSDVGYWLSLYPFGEVINGNYYKFFLTKYQRKRTKYVDSPLCEGSWCNNRCQLAGWLMLYVSIFLIWFTSSNKFSCIYFHDGPIISLSQDFISQ